MCIKVTNARRKPIAEIIFSFSSHYTTCIFHFLISYYNLQIFLSFSLFSILLEISVGNTHLVQQWSASWPGFINSVRGRKLILRCLQTEVEAKVTPCKIGPRDSIQVFKATGTSTDRWQSTFEEVKFRVATKSLLMNSCYVANLITLNAIYYCFQY
jgi:hypothetical protein